ncbi:MAG: orotidine-5'-phosphate decarboxylase [Phycisphaerales bacterium]
MASHFADRICKAVKIKKTPLIVGLDPVYSRLPAAIREQKGMNDAKSAAAQIDAVLEFSTKILKIVAPHVPAIKINIAFFERYLWEGLESYYSLISEAQDLEVEIIGDVKRGDIGHTAESYAQAHLQNPELKGLEDVFAPDAITINGFAGSDGITPFAEVADKQGKGVFVWIRASNPSAAAVQDFADASGVKMYEKLAEITGEIANQPARIGKCGYSNIGMVAGGVTGDQITALRSKYGKVIFLVPGFGSQGASAAECMRFAKSDGTGVLINSSRAIIYAYEDAKYQQQYGDNWEKCVEQAVIDAKIELSKAQ